MDKKDFQRGFEAGFLSSWQGRQMVEDGLMTKEKFFTEFRDFALKTSIEICEREEL